MPRVLVSDKLSPTAVQIFRDRGVDVDYLPDLGPDKEKLLSVIGQYDGLAIRSATKVTEKLIAAATNLKVIGRAGIGVDNVDIPAASRKGIIVMNTPFGNSITTAEHAVAMMFALARQLPEANASTHAGKWEKNRFMGVEITGKTLGVIGCGNIGSIVADAGRRPEDACRRLRSVPVGRPGVGTRRREGRTRRASCPGRFHHAAHAADRQDQEHHQCRIDRQDEGRRLHHQLRARRADRRGRPDRGAEERQGRRRGDRRVRGRAGDGKPALRHGKRRRDAASRRGDHRGAGERRPAGRRADVGLSGQGRGLQRDQHAVDHRRGSAAAETVRQARRGARRLRRPGHRGPDQGGRDPVRRLDRAR